MIRTYYEGMEDQLSALGPALNCTVLWNTVYTNRASDFAVTGRDATGSGRKRCARDDRQTQELIDS